MLSPVKMIVNFIISFIKDLIFEFKKEAIDLEIKETEMEVKNAKEQNDDNYDYFMEQLGRYESKRVRSCLKVVCEDCEDSESCDKETGQVSREED